MRGITLGSGIERPLAEKLLELIPSSAKTVIAYNAGFEGKMIKMLADQYPEMEKELLGIIEKLVDPLPVVKKDGYHKDFQGSFSLKDVAPVLLGSKWSYKSLEVADGQMTQVAFTEMVRPETSQHRKAELRTHLLKYCLQDTEVMVELVNWTYKKTDS